MTKAAATAAGQPSVYRRRIGPGGRAGTVRHYGRPIGVRRVTVEGFLSHRRTLAFTGLTLHREGGLLYNIQEVVNWSATGDRSCRLGALGTGMSVGRLGGYAQCDMWG